jgi:hypothetical protein
MFGTILLIVALAAMFAVLWYLPGEDKEEGMPDWSDVPSDTANAAKATYSFSPIAVIRSGPFKRKTYVEKSKHSINKAFLAANPQGEEPDTEFLENLNNI